MKQKPVIIANPGPLLNVGAKEKWGRKEGVGNVNERVVSLSKGSIVRNGGDELTEGGEGHGGKVEKQKERRKKEWKTRT